MRSITRASRELPPSRAAATVAAMRNLVLLVLASCGNHDAPAPTPAPSPGSGSATVPAHGSVPRSVRCSTAAYNAMRLSHALLMQTYPTMTETMLAEQLALTTDHCVTDGWTDVALNCFADARQMFEIRACDGLLTKDQKTKLDAAVGAKFASLAVVADHGCATALATATPLLTQDLGDQWRLKIPRTMFAQIATLYLSHCRRDGWSPVLLACLSTVKTAADVVACPDLDARQQRLLTSDLEPLYNDIVTDKKR